MKQKIWKKFLTIRLLFTILCSGLLFCQTWQILEQYLRKNSVTNIRFTRNTIDTLPGITICFDKLVSFERVVQRFKEYEDIYMNYTKFMTRINGMKKKFKNMWDKMDEVEDKHLEESKAFREKYDEIIHDFFMRYRVPHLRDLFENFTLPFKFHVDGHLKNSIDMYLSGEEFDVSDCTYNNWTKSYEYNLAPIESMYLFPGKKCFTYFSSLQMRSKKFRANINKITVSIEFPSNWFPYSEDRKVLVALHSPNLLPSLDKFAEIEQATRGKVFFSKIENNELIDRGMCNNYDQSNKSGHHMKSDCMFQCIARSYLSSCVGFMLFNHKYPTRKDLLPGLPPSERCEWNKQPNYDVERRSCLKICKDECYQAYYSFETKMTFKNTQHNQNILYNEVNIEFEPNSLPNVIVHHMPEMSFLSFICSFGGLLGMLLGTSLLEILTNLWLLSRRGFVKLLSFKICKHKNNYTNKLIVNIRPGIRPKYMSARIHSKMSTKNAWK